MQLTAPWLSAPSAQAVLQMLTAQGYRALFVGGCVRNGLLGLAVADVDISTDALPETVIEMARAAGMAAHGTGLDHGTVTLVAQGAAYEVTTFREDIATDGRHATVRFSRDIAADAARRDFTMNALYADATGHVIDPLGGLPDLQARRVRFVGDAGARIREDYLRILRYFRFFAIYGDQDLGLDPDALAACAEHANGLAHLSRERVGSEMRKLLSAAFPEKSVSSMAQTGVLAHILPGADPRALAPLVHLEDGIPCPWVARLAVLGGAAQDLRLSRQDQKALDALRSGIEGTQLPAALGWQHGEALARAIILARAAVMEMPLASKWQADVARGAAARFPVSAADLPHLKGAALGAALRDLQTKWIASDLTLNKAALLP